MDIALSVVVGLVALGVIAFAWVKLSHDPVGKKKRQRRETSGLQGRVDDWLYYQAPTTRPAMKKLFNVESTPNDPPWLRALQTVVRAEVATTSAAPEAAYGQLLARHRGPLVQAFLRGQPSKAIRLHLRRRYAGPDPLFFVWMYLLAYPRYGRRHLYLDALSAALKELRTA
jgi:hypothetical protein